MDAGAAGVEPTGKPPALGLDSGEREVGVDAGVGLGYHVEVQRVGDADDHVTHLGTDLDIRSEAREIDLDLFEFGSDAVQSRHVGGEDRSEFRLESEVAVDARGRHVPQIRSDDRIAASIEQGDVPEPRGDRGDIRSGRALWHGNQNIGPRLGAGEPRHVVGETRFDGEDAALDPDPNGNIFETPSTGDRSLESANPDLVGVHRSHGHVTDGVGDL